MTNSTVNIACTFHGVAGAVVQTTERDIKRATKQAKKKFGAADCKKLHAILARELSAMLPQIAKFGNAVDSYGEFYTNETFDADLLLLAVYDSVGNKRSIKKVFGTL